VLLLLIACHLIPRSPLIFIAGHPPDQPYKPCLLLEVPNMIIGFYYSKGRSPFFTKRKWCSPFFVDICSLDALLTTQTAYYADCLLRRLLSSSSSVPSKLY
jgi:hypothetical protein